MMATVRIFTLVISMVILTTVQVNGEVYENYTIILYLDKYEYYPGESVQLVGYLFDDAGNPVVNVSVQIANNIGIRLTVL